MAAEASALAVVFLALLAGGLARTIYPFIQEQKNREERLRLLDSLPADKLTEEDKLFIENSNKPINFLKYYKYTALLGLGATIAITLTTFTVSLNTLPSDTSFNIALGLFPVFLITGWGGNGISNQLIKSGSSSGSSPVQKIANVVSDSKIVTALKKP